MRETIAISSNLTLPARKFATKLIFVTIDANATCRHEASSLHVEVRSGALNGDARVGGERGGIFGFAAVLPPTAIPAPTVIPAPRAG